MLAISLKIVRHQKPRDEKIPAILNLVLSASSPKEIRILGSTVSGNFLLQIISLRIAIEQFHGSCSISESWPDVLPSDVHSKPLINPRCSSPWAHTVWTVGADQQVYPATELMLNTPKITAFFLWNFSFFWSSVLPNFFQEKTSGWLPNYVAMLRALAIDTSGTGFIEYGHSLQRGRSK